MLTPDIVFAALVVLLLTGFVANVVIRRKPLARQLRPTTSADRLHGAESEALTEWVAALICLAILVLILAYFVYR